MNQEEFDEGQSRIFRALKNDKGPCPEGDVLFLYAQGDLDEENAAGVNTHLSLCGLCMEHVARLQQDDTAVTDFQWKKIEQRLDHREAPWRAEPGAPARRNWWAGFRMPAAVAAALIVGVALWVSTGREPVTGPISTTRGDLVQPQEPAGRIETLGVFRWNEQPAAASFRLQVQDGDKLIWDAVASDPLYRPPQGLLELMRAGTRFRWRVLALDNTGRLLGESAWVEFEVGR